MTAVSIITDTQLITQTESIPLYLDAVSAGFPSPASDHIDEQLDLNDYCIDHPIASFLARVEGDSMCEAGILEGDLLVVDRSLTAKSGDTIVAVYQGQFTVKELLTQPTPRLIPRNVMYPAIDIKSGDDFEVVGVVISVIRKLK